MDKYEKQLRAIELDMKELLGKCRTITGRAHDEARSLKDEERRDLDAHMKSLEVLKEKRAEVEAAIETRKRVEDVGKSMLVADSAPEAQGGAPKRPSYRSIGEAFVKSDGYRALQDRGLRGQWTTGAVEIEGKTLLSQDAGSGGDLVVEDVQAGILPKLFQPLRLADLLGQAVTSSNAVHYMEETTATNGAAAIGEGDTKPESTLVFNRASVGVKKIATLLPVTDEMLEDVPAIESYINGRLSLFVRQEEEDQILNGNGSGDNVSGLIDNLPGGNDAIRSSASGATDADHIYAGITKVREAFVEPDAIVMHPDDWAGIMTLKDGNDRYMGNGPFSEGPDTLWGKRVVVTTAMTSGTALVGAFRECATLFRRGGLSVEASNSHSTYFAENKTAIRAEERIALAVYRPAGFARVDLGASGLLT